MIYQISECSHHWLFVFAVKHPYPFNDQVVIYVRHLGPGVSVGQAWQEGNKLEQIPQKICGEILMVKNYSPDDKITAKSP